MLPVMKKNNVWPIFGGSPFDVLDRLMGEFEPTMLREVERVGAIDVHEDDSHLYVEAELPGFQRDKIDVTLEDGVLQLHAERTEESVDSSDQSEQSAKENYYVRERRTGEWSRAIHRSAFRGHNSSGRSNLRRWCSENRVAQGSL